MIKFGVAGNSASFYAEGHESTLEAAAWLKKRDLDVFEYSFGRGVTLNESTAKKIGAAFAAEGVTVLEAAELDEHSPVPETSSMAARLACDAIAADRIAALPHDSLSPALIDEYRKLGEALAQALPECRAELEHYNHLVEKKDSRWFTRLCRFKPRERF